jgi:hypothetical protein
MYNLGWGSSFLRVDFGGLSGPLDSRVGGPNRIVIKTRDGRKILALCPRKDIYDTQLTCYQDTLGNSDKAKKILTCVTYLYVIHVSIFFGTRTEYRSRYNECLST